jgi:hypothetical protein
MRACCIHNRDADRFFGWFPKGETRFERPPLFGRIRVDTPVRYYLYSLIVLASPLEMRQIKDLVEKMDIRSPTQNGRLRIFSVLVHVLKSQASRKAH